jgi:DHA3 family tetracycline resistance protein-like MFS transporter
LSASLVYYIMGGMSSFAFGMMVTVFSLYYVTKVGLNPLELVLVGTVVEATCFLCEIPTGVVADTYSRRLSIIIGIFLTGIAFGMQGLAPQYWLILLAQVVWGVGATFISGADGAWITDEVGVERVGQIFLRNSQISQVTGVLGVLVSVGLATIELAWPLLLSGAVFLALGVFLSIAMPEHGFKPLPRGERTSWQSMRGTFGDGVKAVRGRPILLTILAVGFFMGAASEGYDRLRDAHLLTQFTFPTFGNFEPVVWFGIISVAGQILSFLTVTVFQKRVKEGVTNPASIARMLLVAQALQIITVLTFALAGYFWLALAALWLKTMLSSVINPLYQTWLNQHIPSEVRATVLSMNSQTDAFGQIAGGPGVGAIGAAFTTRAAIGLAGLLLSPALLLYARVIRANRVPVEAEELEATV